MHIHVPTFARRTSLLRATLVTAAFAALALAAVACGGEDDPDATPASGRVATATSAGATTAGTTPTVAGGTIVPLATDTPAPTATARAVATGAQPAQDVVQMADMVPCSGANTVYYEERTLPSGVHAITYKDVPAGTPILFPFEEGRLKLADARAGAILLIYDVEGVGVVSVHAAGSSSLDRNIAHATKGEVIGHFDATFEELATDIFEDTQLYVITGDEKFAMVGDTYVSGQPLDPEVTDCLVLP